MSLIRSTLIHCSGLWRPYLLTDIKLLEECKRGQRNYILDDYNNTSWICKVSNLILQNLFLDLQDQQDTNSGTKQHLPIVHWIHIFCLPRLWNSLPIIDLTQSFQTIKFKLKNYFWSLQTILKVIICAPFIFIVHVPDA